MSFGRHLIYDFKHVREDVGSSLVACGQILRGHPLPKHPCHTDRGWLKPAWNKAWLIALAILSLPALFIAAVRAMQILSMYPDCKSYICQDFRLAHGRDVYAMACILLLYGCVFTIATARGLVLERRIHLYIRNLAPLAARKQYRNWSGAKGAWIVPVLGFLAVTLTLYAGRSPPESVDPSYPWWFAILVLGLGLAHIIQLIRQHRLQRRFSVFLSNTIPRIRSLRSDPTWPNQLVTNEPPTTPFNLKVRRTLDLGTLQKSPQDLGTSQSESPQAWMEETQGIIDSLLTFSTNVAFHNWEARLVAELKLIAVIVRTTAWSAMLAPIAVLMAMAVYPPVFEGFFTSVAILMLVTAFAIVILVVLRMEADMMFGPIFTRDGDTLTIGGGFRALWPKFVAMGLVLLPIVAPDIWRWMHGLIRSVNSIQSFATRS